MRYRSRHNKSKVKSIYKTKVIILCVSIVLLVIMGSAIMAQRFIIYMDTVQAKDDQILLNNKDEANKNDNLDSEKINENNLEVPSDTPEFIQKYLQQQMKGQMPDDADGVKVVYLTFDDGPSETVTPKILDVLKAEGVHATFFVLGKSIDSSDENKEVIRRIVSEGNTIGIHSYSHNYNYLYPHGVVNVDNFKNEVDKTNASLKSVLGENYSTKAIRLPGGHMTWNGTEALDKYFQQEGYSYIDWNALSRDSEGANKNAEQLVQQVIETTGSKEKVVVLMHDNYGKEETAKSLSNIIKYFKDNGYEFRVIK